MVAPAREAACLGQPHSWRPAIMSLASCTSGFVGQRLAGGPTAARPARQQAPARRHQHQHLVQAAGGQQKDGKAKGE